MPYTVTPTDLLGVLILEPKVFGDARGFFFESFNQRDFAQVTGLEVQFVQDNHSRSVKGVLRGLHYQIRQPQGKLIFSKHWEWIRPILTAIKRKNFILPTFPPEKRRAKHKRLQTRY